MENTTMINYPEKSAASARLSNPIDLSNLLQTGSTTFELSNTADDVEDLFDEDDDEYGRIIEFDDNLIERDNKRKGLKSMKDFKYLRDVSFAPFLNSPEGLFKVEDLFSDGSVRKIVINEGHGPIIPDNSKVFVHYVCATEGANIFDSTLNNERTINRPVSIDLRRANVFPGFYLALKSMRLNEAAKFMIRYDKAYGELGCPPRIPPLTDVMCSIEIISILDESKLNKIEYMSPEERNSLEFSKIFEFADYKKREGNSLYSSNLFGQAKRAYYEAANVLEDYSVSLAEENDEREKLLFTLFNNLAQCCLKLEKWAQACAACKRGLVCSRFSDPQVSKIFYRFAIAKRMLGQPNHALDLIEKALKRDPNNKSIKLEKQSILNSIKNEKELSKSLMTKIGKGMWSDKSERKVTKDANGKNEHEDESPGKSKLNLHSKDESTSKKSYKQEGNKFKGMEYSESDPDISVPPAGFDNNAPSQSDRLSPDCFCESQEQQKQNWEEYRQGMMTQCEACVVKSETPSPQDGQSILTKMAALDIANKDSENLANELEDPVQLAFEWEDYRDRMLSGEENQLEVSEKSKEVDFQEIASHRESDFSLGCNSTGSAGKLVMMDSLKGSMSKRYSLFDTMTITTKAKRLTKKRANQRNNGDDDSDGN